MITDRYLVSCVCVFSVPGDVPDAVAAHNNYQMSRCPGHVSSLSGRACATEILRAEHARNTVPTHHTESRSAQLEIGRCDVNISAHHVLS